MLNRDVFDYEVSIWTLQDEFITVLKHSGTETREQVQFGNLDLKNDGTETLTFSIPMYYYIGNERVENSAWYNTINGNLIVNLRKIKVIFNKKTETEKVFEFLITKVTEEHNNNVLTCLVECESLAFNELGKIGYQISLSEDTYADDCTKWEKEFNDILQDSSSTQEIIDEKRSQEPKNNINYWVDKIMPYVPKWEYKIKMDWNDFYNIETESFQSDKIYEKAISALGPGKEKLRLLEVEESNVYNITQTIAKLFEVFCRYEYEYDQNYHIKKRTIVFYNNYYNESEGAYDITYAYNTSEIRREIDSLHTITKMYVRPIEDETTPTGLIDIMDVEANKTKENYILNFDYLHEIGTISDEQYAAVSEYETNILAKNNRIIPLESAIVSLQNEKTELESQVTFYENATREDRKRLSDNAALWNSKLGGPQENFEGIRVGELNPDVAILKKIENNFETIENGYKYYHYYINISKEGINASSIEIYKDRIYEEIIGTSNPTQYQCNLNTQLNADCYFYNDDGDVNRANITLKKHIGSATNQVNEFDNADSQDGHYVYLKYTYNPHLHYERIKTIWSARLAKDEEKHSRYQASLTTTINNLNYLLDIRNTELAEKTALINKFNKLMGPALREGYWQPEDYTDYTDKYNSYYNFFPITNSTPSNNSSTSSGLDEFIWDTEPFEGEPILTYKDSIEAQSEKYYPYVDLSHSSVRSIFYPNNISNVDLNSLCFLYYNYSGATNDYSRLCSFQVGSKCQFAFLHEDNQYKPILILTGVADLTDDEWTAAKASSMFLGQTQGGISGAVELVSWSKQLSSGALVDPNDLNNDDNPSNDFSGTAIYPRIKINSLSLVDSEDKLLLTYGGNKLEKYKDYSVLIRSDDINLVETSYEGKITEIVNKLDSNAVKTANYITIKPEILLSCGIQKNDSSSSVENLLSLTYSISLTNKAIYYDALTIAKESAYPKTTYDVKLSIFNKDFLTTIYRRLCQIVHINDVDLHFKYIKGYISEISINLDKPWESTVEIKNHKDKFEDLFSTIVAQTEEMKKNSDTIYNVSKIIDGAGFSSSALTTALIKVDFNKAFNNGTLTISEKDGIWGTSDAGVIAFRGGGIFLADSKDANGNWQWHTGIVPQGINANLITAGQLDTNRVMIYAGDKLSFQINSEGIFAYKSFFNEANPDGVSFIGQDVIAINNLLANGAGLDEAQFAKMDSDGFFLTVKKGALVAVYDFMNNSLEFDKTKVKYITIGDNYYDYIQEQDGTYTITSHPKDEDNPSDPYNAKIAAIPDKFDRVAITWDGLTLRNYNGEKVFFMDPNSGNLFIKGNIYTTDFKLILSNGDIVNYTDYVPDGTQNYVNLTTQQIAQSIIDESQAHLLAISNHVDALNEDFTDSLNYANQLLSGVQGNLQSLSDHVDDLNNDFLASLTDANFLLDGVQDNLTIIENKANGLSNDFSNSLNSLTALLKQQPSLAVGTTHTSSTCPTTYSIGDRWINGTIEYIATSNSYSGNNTESNRIKDWVTVGKWDYAGITINDPLGYIKIGAGSKIQLAAGASDSDEGAIEMVTTDANATHVFSLNHEGIKIGSGKAITLFSNQGVTGTGAAAELSEKRILFGVSSTASNSESVVDLDTNGIIITTGAHTSFTGENKTSENFDLITGNSGVKITKELIGMKVLTSLLWMDSTGLELGTLSGNGTRQEKLLTGSYVFIKHADGVEIGTKVDNNPTIASFRNNRVLIATRTGTYNANDSENTRGVSAADIQPNKIILVSSLNTNGDGDYQQYNVYQNFTDENSNHYGIAKTLESYSPNSTSFPYWNLSGLRITPQNIGLAVSTSSTGTKSVIWMDNNGVEIGSLTKNGSITTNLAGINVDSGSYVLIKRTQGVEIGTGDTNSNCAVVSIQSKRVAITTGSSTDASIVDIVSGKVIITSGDRFDKSFSDLSNTYDNFNPLAADKAGVRITKNDIGLAVIASGSSYKNLIWMDANGVEIGSVIANSDRTNSTTKISTNSASGGYILIKRESGVTIGTGNNENASIISLANDGKIHAVNGTLNSNNYAAFNLGYGENNTYGFELETTGKLTIGKRIPSIMNLYPLQIQSDSLTNTQIALRHITQNTTSSSGSQTIKFSTILLRTPANSDNGIFYVYSEEHQFSNGTELSGNDYHPITINFSITKDGEINNHKGIFRYKAGKNTTNNVASTGSVSFLYDSIRAYTTVTEGSTEYVNHLYLSDGTVLNFNRPASGTNINSVIPKISAGNGASANFYLTDGTNTTTTAVLGTLEPKYFTDSNMTTQSQYATGYAYIQFTPESSYLASAGTYAAIDLSAYWNNAQNSVTLKSNSSNSTIKLSKTSGDLTVAYLKFNNSTLSDATEILLSNNNISGTDGTTYGTISLSNYWNAIIENKINVNYIDQKSYSAATGISQDSDWGISNRTVWDDGKLWNHSNTIYKSFYLDFGSPHGVSIKFTKNSSYSSSRTMYLGYNLSNDDSSGTSVNIISLNNENKWFFIKAQRIYVNYYSSEDKSYTNVSSLTIYTF